jgi:hypothetical protein
MSGVNFNALLPERIPELQASPHFDKFQQLLRASDGDLPVQSMGIGSWFGPMVPRRRRRPEFGGRRIR